jgi:hypothetical protein
MHEKTLQPSIPQQDFSHLPARPQSPTEGNFHAGVFGRSGSCQPGNVLGGVPTGAQKVGKNNQVVRPACDGLVDGFRDGRPGKLQMREQDNALDTSNFTNDVTQLLCFMVGGRNPTSVVHDDQCTHFFALLFWT